MDLRSFAKSHLPAPVNDALKVAKYNFDLWTFSKEIVSHRYGPHRLKMHIHDRVAKEWYDKDWELPPEMAFLAGHGLDQGALVFDLGAHQCLIAMMLAKQVGPQGHVVAVEANRHNVSVARRNVALNRVDNVTVTHAMISNRAGRERAEASFNSSHGASAIAGDMVDTLTIDDMSERLGRPRVVFMDIEGFEIEALKGARETLRQRLHLVCRAARRRHLAALRLGQPRCLAVLPRRPVRGLSLPRGRADVPTARRRGADESAVSWCSCLPRSATEFARRPWEKAEIRRPCARRCPER